MTAQRPSQPVLLLLLGIRSLTAVAILIAAAGAFLAISRSVPGGVVHLSDLAALALPPSGSVP